MLTRYVGGVVSGEVEYPGADIVDQAGGVGGVDNAGEIVDQVAVMVLRGFHRITYKTLVNLSCVQLGGGFDLFKWLYLGAARVNCRDGLHIDKTEMRRDGVGTMFGWGLSEA